MPYATYRLGGTMDEDFRHRIDGTDPRYHRASMVARVAVRPQLDKPQHTLYCPGHRDAAVLLAVVIMVGQDSKRLQDLPASH